MGENDRVLWSFVLCPERCEVVGDEAAQIA